MPSCLWKTTGPSAASGGGGGTGGACARPWVRAHTAQAGVFFPTATESGTISEPANAENVIAVGSFDTKLGGSAGQVGNISSFSRLRAARGGRQNTGLTEPLL